MGFLYLIICIIEGLCCLYLGDMATINEFLNDLYIFNFSISKNKGLSYLAFTHFELDNFKSRSFDER